MFNIDSKILEQLTKLPIGVILILSALYGVYRGIPRIYNDFSPYVLQMFKDRIEMAAALKQMLATKQARELLELRNTKDDIISKN